MILNQLKFNTLNCCISNIVVYVSKSPPAVMQNRCIKGSIPAQSKSLFIRGDQVGVMEECVTQQMCSKY